MKIHRKYKRPTINPNTGTNYWKGWCDAQVRESFTIPPKYGSAAETYKHTKRKHTDRNFPNADVPIFYSLKGEPAGHVAVRLANGEVETTGLNNTVMRFPSIEAFEQRWSSLKYLGWTEDLKGKDIITGYTPTKPAKNKTVAQLADEVIAGKHGNGAARKKSLGKNYAAVQAEVNKRLSGRSKSISQLAAEVIAGKHGNGAARKKSLGSQYAAVQAEVNRRLK